MNVGDTVIIIFNGRPVITCVRFVQAAWFSVDKDAERLPLAYDHADEGRTWIRWSRGDDPARVSALQTAYVLTKGATPDGQPAYSSPYRGPRTDLTR